VRNPIFNRGQYDIALLFAAHITMLLHAVLGYTAELASSDPKFSHCLARPLHFHYNNGPTERYFSVQLGLNTRALEFIQENKTKVVSKILTRIHSLPPNIPLFSGDMFLFSTSTLGTGWSSFRWHREEPNAFSNLSTLLQLNHADHLLHEAFLASIGEQLNAIFNSHGNSVGLDAFDHKLRANLIFTLRDLENLNFDSKERLLLANDIDALEDNNPNYTRSSFPQWPMNVQAVTSISGLGGKMLISREEYEQYLLLEHVSVDRDPIINTEEIRIRAKLLDGIPQWANVFTASGDSVLAKAIQTYMPNPSIQLPKDLQPDDHRPLREMLDQVLFNALQTIGLDSSTQPR